MARAIGLRNALFRFGVGLAAAVSWAAIAMAEDSCGLCNDEIVVDEAHASCFLERYQQFADKNGAVVAVDLSDCPSDRDAIIQPLPSPDSIVVEPDTKFLVTKDQLVCIKTKLEEPGLVIKPFIKIPLASCAS